MQVSSTQITLLECLQEVHNQVLRQHSQQCVAASKALKAERITHANSPAASQDALRTMMHLSQAQECLTKGTTELKNIKQRADKFNKEALELEKAVDVAAKTGSRGGFTEWMRMPQVLHLRSGMQSRTLTTRRLLCQ